MYFPMKLEYTIYYLSPDPFCYIVSLLFLYAEYEDPVHQIYQLLPDYLMNIFNCSWQIEKYNTKGNLK